MPPVQMQELWLPVLVAAVLVFVVSSLVHMVFKWHAADYRKLPDEDGVTALMRKSGVTPGQYFFPHCTSHKQFEDPTFVQKFVQGPVGMMIVRPSGKPNLGPSLAKWFVYTIVVGVVVGYVAHVTLGHGARPATIARIVGVTAWLAYCWQSPQDAIWMGKPVRSVAVYMLDGLLYAAVTAAAFCWLWPK